MHGGVFLPRAIPEPRGKVLGKAEPLNLGPRFIECADDCRRSCRCGLLAFIRLARRHHTFGVENLVLRWQQKQFLQRMAGDHLQRFPYGEGDESQSAIE